MVILEPCSRPLRPINLMNDALRFAYCLIQPPHAAEHGVKVRQHLVADRISVALGLQVVQLLLNILRQLLQL